MSRARLAGLGAVVGACFLAPASPAAADVTIEPHGDPVVMTPRNGGQIYEVTRMPTSIESDSITIGDVARASSCAGAETLQIDVYEDGRGPIGVGQAKLPDDLGRLQVHVGQGEEVDPNAPPVKFVQGHSYSINATAFPAETYDSNCLSYQRRVWDEGPRQVEAPALCTQTFDSTGANDGTAVWHLEGVDDQSQNCTYPPLAHVVDPSMPTGWLVIVGGWTTFYLGYSDFAVAQNGQACPSPGADGPWVAQAWRDTPGFPGSKDYVCYMRQFLPPGQTSDDGWHYALPFNLGSQWPRESYISLAEVGPQSVDGINLAALAAQFGGASGVCDAVLTYPGHTNVNGTTLSDQELACEAAVRSGTSLKGVLAAVAAAGGGTAVLWWLNHQVGVTLPGATPATPPATLPASWPVQSVADAVRVKSPSLTTTAARAVAASCLWLAAAANLHADHDCESLPIFASGSDVAQATQHDLEALASPKGPAWVKLNYEYGKAKRKRRWAKSQPECKHPDPGQDCDEYPFFATEQGGPLAPLRPSLKLISAIDNQFQGSLYSVFQRACELQTGTPVKGANSQGGSPFLSIPLPPALGIPTQMLCNK